MRKKAYLMACVNFEEVQQIEQWTKKTCSELIYDSNRDGYPREGTSKFSEKVVKKENLLFIVEDEEGNKFGEYVQSKIIRTENHISDKNAFVFSLKSNRRLDGMKKFNIIKDKYAFAVWNDNDEDLFFIGCNGANVKIKKYGNQSRSQVCNQKLFDYEGIENALIGRIGEFKPKRITVIQME